MISQIGVCSVSWDDGIHNDHFHKIQCAECPVVLFELLILNDIIFRCVLDYSLEKKLLWFGLTEFLLPHFELYSLLDKKSKLYEETLAMALRDNCSVIPVFVMRFSASV